MAHVVVLAQDYAFGRDFALTDHNGKPRTLADFRGKVVVLFLGYAGPNAEHVAHLLPEAPLFACEFKDWVGRVYPGTDAEPTHPEQLWNKSRTAHNGP